MTPTATVLKPVPESPPLRTPLGASATCEGNRILLRNSAGAVVVEFDAETGSATIAAPSGDLRLAAPNGSVVMEAGTALRFSAPKTTLEGDECDLRTRSIKIQTLAMGLVAEALDLSSTSLSLGAGRLQVSAERVIEKARDVYRDVEGVLETKAGRIRSLVRGAWQVRSESTSLVSREDAFIDGRRVLLG